MFVVNFYWEIEMNIVVDRNREGFYVIQAFSCTWIAKTYQECVSTIAMLREMYS